MDTENIKILNFKILVYEIMESIPPIETIKILNEALILATHHKKQYE